MDSAGSLPLQRLERWRAAAEAAGRAEAAVADKWLLWMRDSGPAPSMEEKEHAIALRAEAMDLYKSAFGPD